MGGRKEMTKQEKRELYRTDNKHSKVQKERKRNMKGIKETQRKTWEKERNKSIEIGKHKKQPRTEAKKNIKMHTLQYSVV